MERQLRWGVIGAAGIARTVVPAIQASASGTVVAVASRSYDKAKAFADQYDIPTAYGTYEDLLEDKNVDAVYIPLPNHLHKEWTIRAARAGKHVLCEKPFALNAEEAEEMVAACEEANVLLAEAFMYRHHPRFERIAELIRDGAIGRVRAMRGAFTFNNAGDKANVRYRADWGGGSAYDVGCYPLSAARLFMGTEPVAATAHAFFSAEHDGVDMMCSGLVEFDDEVALTFECGMWADFRNSFDILGTEGRIEIPETFLPSADGIDFVLVSGGRRTEEKQPYSNQYTLQADNFARAVFEGTPLRFDGRDAVRNMKVIDAVLLSAREKRRVEIGGD